MKSDSEATHPQEHREDALGMASKPKKRRDACLFCQSRSCYERVVSTDGGKAYDEIACLDHIKDMHKHSDINAPGIMKHFISSTAKQKRGHLFKP